MIVRSLGFLLKIAWRNLIRHARRSLITASAMAVGVGLCMASIALNDGIYGKIFEVLVERSLGHALVRHPDFPRTQGLFSYMEGGDDKVLAIEALPGVRAVSGRVFGFALLSGEGEAAGARLTGVDPARERNVGPLADQIVGGRYLADAPAHEILLGDELAEDLHVAPGGSVVVVTQAADGSTGNDLYTVVGTFHTGSVQADRAGATLHLADLRSLLVLDGKLHEIVLLADDDSREGIAAFAQQARGAVGDGPLVQPWWEASPSAAQMMDMRQVASLIMLGVVFTVAAFGVANTMTMSVMERTRELGILQAVGMRPGRVVLLVMAESVLLAGLACALGLVFGGALDLWLVTRGVDFSDALDSFEFAGIAFEPVIRGEVRADGVILTLSAVFFVSILASIGPAVRAARMRPVESLRAD